MTSDDWLPAAETAARAAGCRMRDARVEGYGVRRKEDGEIVTDVDLACEREILEILRKRFPQDAILSEEAGRIEGSSSYLWIVDPIDGTSNFVRGLPASGVSIARVWADTVVAAVVHNPWTQELFAAERGAGACLNGERIRVATTDGLAAATCAFGVCDGFWGDERTRAALASLGRAARDLRLFNAAALDLASVAAGRLDAFWELVCKPWDYAAGMLLVKEAGGRVTDIEGRPLALNTSTILASNGSIHDELRGILEGIGPGW